MGGGRVDQERIKGDATARETEGGILIGGMEDNL